MKISVVKPDFRSHTIVHTHIMKACINIRHPATMHLFEIKTEFPVKVFALDTACTNSESETRNDSLGLEKAAA